MPQEFSRDMAVNDLKPSGFRLKELARMFEEGRRHEFSSLKTVEDFLISFPCQRCKPANKQWMVLCQVFLQSCVSFCSPAYFLRTSSLLSWFLKCCRIQMRCWKVGRIYKKVAYQDDDGMSLSSAIHKVKGRRICSIQANSLSSVQEATLALEMREDFGL